MTASGPSNLFQLDQSTAEILGVQEQHRLAVRADLGFAVAENPRPGGAKAIFQPCAANQAPNGEFVPKQSNSASPATT